MAENYKIFPLNASPGIKRDTTDTEGNYWSKGVWSRFYRGLPRSIQGYRSATETYPGPSRGLFTHANGGGFVNVFSGASSTLNVSPFTSACIGTNPTDITPSGFTSSSNNIWQFDSFYNSNGGGQISIIAHAAQNLAAIDNNVAAPVYYGNINGTSSLVSATAGGSGTFTIDGGIVSLQPYLVAYGSLGLVAWTAVGNPTDFPTANAANVCSTKIVKGLPIRGGSNSPSALLWSLDSVIQMSFVGGSAIWNFNTLTDQSSILSSSAVVEMDGIYYWPGVDRFLYFNGVLHELPNEMNLDFFYTNLNFAQRQKVFGFKIPRWGEIWWCFPFGNSTECNWAVIFNVRENTWYDTPLPVDGRSAAFFSRDFQQPIMSSAKGLLQIGSNSTVVYPIWQHEYGYDQIRGNQVNAIPSSILSPTATIIGGDLTLLGSSKVSPQSVRTQMVRFEPDFKNGGSLNFYTYGRDYPMDNDTLLNMTTFTQQTSNNQYDIQVQGRYLRWMIESNIQNGYYIMGSPFLHYRVGDPSP